MQERLEHAAINGHDEDVLHYWNEIRLELSSTDVTKLGKKLCMAVSKSRTASAATDQALKRVLEVLLENGCVVTEPMLAACSSARASSAIACREEYLRNRLNQVCLLTCSMFVKDDLPSQSGMSESDTSSLTVKASLLQLEALLCTYGFIKGRAMS